MQEHVRRGISTNEYGCQPIAICSVCQGNRWERHENTIHNAPWSSSRQVGRSLATHRWSKQWLLLLNLSRSYYLPGHGPRGYTGSWTLRRAQSSGEAARPLGQAFAYQVLLGKNIDICLGIHQSRLLSCYSRDYALWSRISALDSTDYFSDAKTQW